jgi:hypothetical protein
MANETGLADHRRTISADKPFTAGDFRAELVKIMPGYRWTVRRASKGATRLVATGIQSSGFNRLSTLQVERVIERGAPWYKAKSAGHGTRATFLHENGDVTLARALRGLQEYYERKANTYRGHAARLQNGRTTPESGIARLGGGA